MISLRPNQSTLPVWIALAIPLIMAAGCNTLLRVLATTAPAQRTLSRTSPPPPELAGTYDCSAGEYGLLVGIGSFSVRMDGIVIDELSGKTGLWTYDSARNELAITGDLDVDRAVYHAENGTLDFYLRPGMSRMHVQNGVLNCSRRP